MNTNQSQSILRGFKKVEPQLEDGFDEAEFRDLTAAMKVVAPVVSKFLLGTISASNFRIQMNKAAEKMPEKMRKNFAQNIERDFEAMGAVIKQATADVG